MKKVQNEETEDSSSRFKFKIQVQDLRFMRIKKRDRREISATAGQSMNWQTQNNYEYDEFVSIGLSLQGGVGPNGIQRQIYKQNSGSFETAKWRF
jgi:hypothetical protein